MFLAACNCASSEKAVDVGSERADVLISCRGIGRRRFPRDRGDRRRGRDRAEHDAKRINVGAVIDRRIAARLLRRHVGRRPGHQTVRSPQSVVRNPRSAIRNSGSSDAPVEDEDFAELSVAVADFFSMEAELVAAFSVRVSRTLPFMPLIVIGAPPALK